MLGEATFPSRKTNCAALLINCATSSRKPSVQSNGALRPNSLLDFPSTFRSYVQNPCGTSPIGLRTWTAVDSLQFFLNLFSLPRLNFRSGKQAARFPAELLGLPDHQGASSSARGKPPNICWPECSARPRHSEMGTLGGYTHMASLRALPTEGALNLPAWRIDQNGRKLSRRMFFAPRRIVRTVG